MSLTPKQQRVYQYIRDFCAERGYAPSQWEIANHFGFRSLGTVQDYLVRLEHHGYLEKSLHGKRAIRIQPLGKDKLHLPLLGRVAAGNPIEAALHDEQIEVPASMLQKGGSLFALEVNGDSMIDEGILDGDHIIVRKQENAENGQTVVALIDGEATVKRYYRHGQQVELRPANSQYQPIQLSNETALRIAGVLVGVIRHVA